MKNRSVDNIIEKMHKAAVINLPLETDEEPLFEPTEPIEEVNNDFVDLNTINLQEIRRIAKSMGDEEVHAMVSEFAKTHPDVIFTVLMDEFTSMKHVISTISDSLHIK